MHKYKGIVTTNFTYQITQLIVDTAMTLPVTQRYAASRYGLRSCGHGWATANDASGMAISQLRRPEQRRSTAAMTSAPQPTWP